MPQDGTEVLNIRPTVLFDWTMAESVEMGGIIAGIENVIKGEGGSGNLCSDNSAGARS